MDCKVHNAIKDSGSHPTHAAVKDGQITLSCSQFLLQTGFIHKHTKANSISRKNGLLTNYMSSLCNVHLRKSATMASAVCSLTWNQYRALTLRHHKLRLKYKDMERKPQSYMARITSEPQIAKFNGYSSDILALIWMCPLIRSTRNTWKPVIIIKIHHSK